MKCLGRYTMLDLAARLGRAVRIHQRSVDESSLASALGKPPSQPDRKHPVGQAAAGSSL